MDRRGFIRFVVPGLVAAAAGGYAARVSPAALPDPGGLDLVGLGPVAYLERLDGGYIGPVPAGEERPGVFVAEWRDMVLAEDVIVTAALVVRNGRMRRHEFSTGGRVICDGDTYVLHVRP